MWAGIFFSPRPRLTVAHSCHSLHYFGGRQYFAESSHSRGTQSIPPVYEVAGVANCTFISAQIMPKRRESRDAFGQGVFSTIIVHGPPYPPFNPPPPPPSPGAPPTHIHSHTLTHTQENFLRL